MNEGLSRRQSLGALAASSSVGLVTGKASAMEAGACHLAHRNQLLGSMQKQEAILLLEEGREGILRWHSGDFTEAVRVDLRQAIHVPSPDDPTGKRGVWKRAVNGGIQITWFGAKFDLERSDSIANATDDSEAWEAALAYLEFTGGGTLHLPHGASKVTREIAIPYNGVHIVGTGTRKVYPGRFRPGKKCPSTLVPVHSGRSAIRFLAGHSGDGAFCAENFNLAALEEGEQPECAFGWEVQDAFFYGYTFSRLGVHGFTSAFDSYKGKGKEYAVGGVLIDNCVINRNRWIVRSMNKTQFNAFRFTNNKAGQNGYLPGQGGIAISGQDVAIENNILEATRDPVFVFGGHRDVSVKGNYFEANVGKACVHLRDIVGPYSVGPNNYSVLNYDNIEHKVLLSFCGMGACIDPCWPNVTHKVMPAMTGGDEASTLKNSVDTAIYGFCRLDRPDGLIWSARPSLLASASAVTKPEGELVRATSPQTGIAMPVQRFSTSDRTFIEKRATLAGEKGDWVVTSWLFNRLPDKGPPVDPYISMRVDGATSNGSRDYVTFGYSRAWRDGEWCLITLAIRLEAPMAWMQLLFHPHGVEAAAGRTTQHSDPTVYTIADVNDIRPYFDTRQACTVIAPPSTGNWFVGDALHNAAPEKGATRFICTKAGFPGTWVRA